MTRRWELVGAALALAASVMAAAPNVRADGAASGNAAQAGELARMRYRQGVDAYGAARYREAVDYFLEADTLAPNAALSYNIGRAYEKLGDTSAALRWYRDYLRRAPDAKDRTETETLVHGFEARLVEKGVQQVTVLSDPEGATLLIDDRAVGATPFTTELAPGSHRVELRMGGHESTTATLDLPPDHAVDLALTLPASAAPMAAPAPAAAAPAPSGDHVSERSGGFPARTVGWTLVGVGGAALGTALAFEILRHNAESEAKRETTQIGYADRLDAAESRQTAARIFLATGAALAIGGGVMVWVGSRKKSERPPAVTAGCGPSMCWSTVRGTF